MNCPGVVNFRLSLPTSSDQFWVITTKNEKSDIDLMVVGEMPLEDLLKRLREPEKLLEREINPSLFHMSELKQRMKDQDPFIGRLMAEAKIMLVGDEEELRRLAQ